MYSYIERVRTALCDCCILAGKLKMLNFVLSGVDIGTSF